ncbi:MAG: nuclear transport factor 2 family protein [Salaquimonas sp.]|jgi:ketosteroid isomerase-like protein|nr:nuclear transport factor 2 family protein [Salaquimonas sp.]
MERNEMTALLDKLADGFNTHDIDALMSLFSEECSLDMPRGSEPHGTRYVGPEAVRGGLMTRFETTPDVHYGEIEHFVDGDTGISKWLLTGTTTEGRRIAVRGCDFYSVSDGKVVRKDSYWKIVT